MYSEVRSTTSVSARWLVWHRHCAYLSAYLSSAVLLVVLADNPSLPPGRLGKEDRHLKIYELWDNLNLVIDDNLLDIVMRRYNIHTKTEAVDVALRHLAGQPMTTAEALAMRGSIPDYQVPGDRGPR